jgi:hypothetical protein
MVLQHSLDHTKGQAVPTITIHTTPLATILSQHSLWRVKGQTMAMTIIRTILLAASLSQHLLWHMNGQATTMTHERPSHYYESNPYHSVTNVPPPIFGPQSTTSNRDEEECERQLEEATIQSQKDYIQKLEEITASLIYSGTRFISSTLDYHLVQAGPAAN